MTIRLGINGFGRIGRLVVRGLQHQPGIELVHINELKGGVETAAHLLEFDTVHGRYPGTISRWQQDSNAQSDSNSNSNDTNSDDTNSNDTNSNDTNSDDTNSNDTNSNDTNSNESSSADSVDHSVREDLVDRFIIDGKTVSYSAHSKPGDVPWEDYGVDIVIEATGKFKTTQDLQPYFARGVRKVIVAAPVKSAGVLNIVLGCNDDLYDPAVHHIVTAASCTTNCLAPVVKVLHENIGIERGAITTIHDVTNTQVIVDAPHKDLRRARSALNSLIPTSTGSATAITLIYPELAGKLNGMAVRVPLLNASLTDAVFTMSRDVTVEEVNALFAEAAAGPLKGILGYEERPLVSADYTNDTRSAIIDAPSTMVIDGRMLKVLAWYDNEYGYAFRMAELAGKVAGSITALIASSIDGPASGAIVSSIQVPS